MVPTMFPIKIGKLIRPTWAGVKLYGGAGMYDAMRVTETWSAAVIRP
jgi:hypothetical protein